MKPVCTLFAAVSLLAQGAAVADSGRSLNEVRSQMNSGTWPGITLIEARPKAPAQAASAASAPVLRSAGQTAAAPPPQPAAQSAPRWRLGTLFEAPSGRPMNQATRLDSPSLGIPVPTASSRAASAATPSRAP